MAKTAAPGLRAAAYEICILASHTADIARPSLASNLSQTGGFDGRVGVGQKHKQISARSRYPY
jgi:hypothetical protein